MAQSSVPERWGSGSGSGEPRLSTVRTLRFQNCVSHQGAQTVYVYRVGGPTQEELLSTIQADQVPKFNACHV